MSRFCPSPCAACWLLGGGAVGFVILAVTAALVVGNRPEGTRVIARQALLPDTRQPCEIIDLIDPGDCDVVTLLDVPVVPVDDPVRLVIPLDRLAPVDPVAPDGPHGIFCEFPEPPAEWKPANQLYAGQCGTTRVNLLEIHGGNKESEAAVAKGLAWLARQQKKDGTWAFDDGGDKAAATGMALLPFLAAGHTQVPTKENKYRDTATAGLLALLAIQKKSGDGRFSDNAYAHAIATLAVCEALGRTGDKVSLKKPCQAAVDAIQDAQGPNGSWGYKAKSDGDTCIVGWQVQALHAAKMCKELKVDPKALDKAMKFLDSVASGTSKYMFRYTDAASARPTMSAVGLLCRCSLSGWGPNSAGLKDGAAYLLKEHPPEKEQEYDLYYYYYATQVLRDRGGDGWAKEWNPKMRDLLVGKQISDEKKPNVDGSWDKDATWIGTSCGRLGTTALAVLTLEVYYRHLPAGKRGTGGLEELDK